MRVEGHWGGRRRKTDQMWAQGLDICAHRKVETLARYECVRLCEFEPGGES